MPGADKLVPVNSARSRFAWPDGGQRLARQEDPYQ